ncbi:NADP-dependent 3-hydroxy acid dehydrogenase YdfG [Sagittula marina]|uniref:NADP-dependent 3-hydroxy acid dehydrogenase YdfG n=1 Tax=Sagittula marina TaxID=943940 RepID=A0A7W6DNN9_9RHOB|nr:SDR family oxidoreductase [Sagittula marina]MBB3986077.1 NADP-dependent 3-hydroxy acid dehydrogenase YdfG [Sagittula marina]
MSKTLFITGASSGIGAATARTAVESGWNVGLFARSEDKLGALVEELGDQALALPGDATSLNEQRAAIGTLVERYGKLDAAFANAGMGLSAAGTEKGDPDEWETLVKLNVLGLLWTVKAAMPQLKANTGHMLLTGSAAGRTHIKGSVYGASKWFVHGYGGNLAQEMREWGGRCTVIAPGMVDTPFFDEAKPDKLKPEDIARAAVYALEQPAHACVQEMFVMPTG